MGFAGAGVGFGVRQSALQGRKVALPRSGSSDAPQVRHKAARRNSAVRAARASSDLRRHLLDTGDADDVHGTEHDGFIAFGKCHQHRVLDDGRILRVIDEKDIPAAAPNLERLKRRLPKIHSNLLEHGWTIFLGETKASARSLLPRLPRVVGFPEFGGGAGAGVGFAGVGVGFAVRQSALQGRGLARVGRVSYLRVNVEPSNVRLLKSADMVRTVSFVPILK